MKRGGRGLAQTTRLHRRLTPIALPAAIATLLALATATALAAPGDIDRVTFSAAVEGPDPDNPSAPARAKRRRR